MQRDCWWIKSVKCLISDLVKVTQIAVVLSKPCTCWKWGLFFSKKWFPQMFDAWTRQGLFISHTDRSVAELTVNLVDATSRPYRDFLQSQKKDHTGKSRSSQHWNFIVTELWGYLRISLNGSIFFNNGHTVTYWVLRYRHQLRYNPVTYVQLPIVGKWSWKISVDGKLRDGLMASSLYN